MKKRNNVVTLPPRPPSVPSTVVVDTALLAIVTRCAGEMCEALEILTAQAGVELRPKQLRREP